MLASDVARIRWMTGSVPAPIVQKLVAVYILSRFVGLVMTCRCSTVFEL